MMHSSSEQLWQALIFLGFGSTCGAAAAWRTVLSRLKKPTAFRRFTGDCLFCVISVICLFLVSLSVNAGQLRFISLAFAALGYALAFAVCLPVFSAVQRALLAIYRQFRHFIRPPFALITRFGSYFCKKTRFFCKKGLRYKHVMMYNYNK